MNREQILEELNHVFKEVFLEDSLVINEQTSPEDIEDWDSLSQITLVAAIEKRFNIKFSLEDMLSLKNVKDIIDVVQK